MNSRTTYGLLLRSQETGRGIMETVIYALLSVCVIISIVEFAQQLPISGVQHFVRHTTESSGRV